MTKVTAMIEVRTNIQNEDYNRVARRIYQFDEVQTMYLVSGSFDLRIVVVADDFEKISNFVSNKLSTLSDVTATKTHFILKTYKENGVICANDEEQEERVQFI